MQFSRFCFHFRFPLSAFSFLVAVHLTQAANIVVDQKNPRAADQNSGTKEKPLKTISAAAARVKPGDHVIIHRGDYRETVIIKASGTPEAPIVFEGAPGETPVIKGSDVITGWTRQSPNVWKAKLPVLPERSDKGDDPSYWKTNDVHQVFVKDGVMLEAIRLRMTPPDALREGNFYCDKANSDIYIWLKEAQNPNRLTIEASVRGAWLQILGSNVIMRNVQMRHASTLAFANWPACNIYGTNSRLENCAITWGDFCGVSLQGNGASLLGCLIACHGDSGIGGTGENHVIEKCRVIYNNTDHYDPSWHCGGAKLIPGFNNSRITGNEFAHNIGPGLWLDESCNNNCVERNYCHDNEGAGIQVEISSGNLVLNNICVANRNTLGGEFLSPDPEAEKQGRHNIFLTRKRNERTESTIVYQGGEGLGIFISSSPDSRVYNNTCYLNEGGGITVEGPDRQSGGRSMSTQNCRVANNISVLNKGPQLILRKIKTDATTSGNSSENNLLLAVGGILAKNGWAAQTAMSLADWQRITDQDQHSREGDPQFAGAAMGDFRLMSSSPAAHTGEPIADVPTDYFGNARPKDKVSIGACEIGTDYPRPAGVNPD